MKPAEPIDPLAAHRVAHEPFYQPGGDEVARFEAVHEGRLPLIVRGPPGCGKTRFVAHMAWRLKRPLLTVACHADLGLADLLGGWQAGAGGARWQDGPVTLAARFGGICCLDELGAARAGTAFALLPITDTCRRLLLAAHGEVVPVHPDFQLVVCEGHSPMAQALSPAIRQRFCAMAFAWPDPEREAGIVARESGLDIARASAIAAFGVRTRRLQGDGLQWHQGASTRMLVHAAVLVVQGLSLAAACQLAMVDVLGLDHGVHEALQSALDASF